MVKNDGAVKSSVKVGKIDMVDYIETTDSWNGTLREWSVMLSVSGSGGEPNILEGYRIIIFLIMRVFCILCFNATSVKSVVFFQ